MTGTLAPTRGRGQHAALLHLPTRVQLRLLQRQAQRCLQGHAGGAPIACIPVRVAHLRLVQRQGGGAERARVSPAGCNQLSIDRDRGAGCSLYARVLPSNRRNAGLYTLSQVSPHPKHSSNERRTCTTSGSPASLPLFPLLLPAVSSAAAQASTFMLKKPPSMSSREGPWQWAAGRQQ